MDEQTKNALIKGLVVLGALLFVFIYLLSSGTKQTTGSNVSGYSFTVENPIDGIVVTLNRFEETDNAYMYQFKISNNTDKKIMVLSSSAKIVQGSKQLDSQLLAFSGYDKMQTDVMPGVTTEGWLGFEKEIDIFNEQTLFMDVGGFGSEQLRINMKAEN